MELFNKINFKQFFTLIELIVVIVVLGVLAAIVIPNISSFKEEAQETAIKSDTRSIQTAVDMFMLDYHGATPTKEKATLGNPQIVELYGLKPDYLRDLPKENGAKFWLDGNNTVWSSRVDAPINVTYDAETQKLSWETVDGATLYKVYSTTETVKSSATSSAIQHQKDVEATEGMKQAVELKPLDKGFYLVTAVDTFDSESAPTGENTDYKGYGEGPKKDFSPELLKPKEPVNQQPVAVIGITPEKNVDTETDISWDFKKSTDPENHAILKAEWKLNGALQPSMPTKLPVGTHVIELRVQDEKGTWSEWVRKEVPVTKMNFASATFTNAGATGSFGPAQSQLDAAYSGTVLSGLVTSTSGIQNWLIPATGNYRIETYGARGGSNGGYGARMIGTFSLKKGDSLKILVGQMGAKTGGGGGTFVSTSDNTPLIVAGGGGGNKANSTSHGTTSSNGLTGEGGTPTAGFGGTNGNGGGQNKGEGASGGAGFYGNGWRYLGGSTGSTTNALTAFSFVNGGKGNDYAWSNAGVGGFGGGASGGSLGAGGGAGGYSGGGAGASSGFAGGGGGSYNSGTNQSNTSAVNIGHGKVVITLIK